ncbi:MULTISPECIES: hypothetical protein [Cyanophyceae]|uniref:hypothetical protein n=1 Tax=Cyanophyceae TaxID=3028117 RepID=UPI001682540B|nr:hypothetical protein [Phormidium sp. FACHB-592]
MPRCFALNCQQAALSEKAGIPMRNRSSHEALNAYSFFNKAWRSPYPLKAECIVILS